MYAAAEHISAERAPTVSAVREAAAVSMADASRYLKQWKQEQATATAAVVAAPGTVTDQAAKLAGTLWTEAVKLAGEDHRPSKQYGRWRRPSYRLRLTSWSPPLTRPRPPTVKKPTPQPKP